MSKGRDKPRTRWAAYAASVAMAAVAAAWLAGCAATQQGAGESGTESASLRYYAYQVKGYQKSYPARKVLILLPLDDYASAGKSVQSEEPEGEGQEIGVIENREGQVQTRLFTHGLTAVVQRAIASSANEAGMMAKTLAASTYEPGKSIGQDYVLASRITRCMVIRRRGPGGEYGASWYTTGEFALSVAIYKPPFQVPFWQGVSSATFKDPADDTGGMGDETAIYDRPEEVLSVALTQGVAGIFNRSDLHALAIEDKLIVH